MNVKSTLKRWIQSVDEALLTELETSETVQTPAVLLEDQEVPPTSLMTVSPLSPLVTPGHTVTSSVDIATDIDSIIAPKYVQINSPRRIEPELLAPFEKGLKDVSVVFAHNQHVIQARLESIHDTYLVVRSQHSTYFRKRGEVVLILLPASPEKRYVLQLTIQEIYAHRLILRYQDPRYDTRRKVQLVEPVHLRPSPPMLLATLRQCQARIIRQATLPPEEALSTTPGRLVDQLCELDTPTLSPVMQQNEQIPPLSSYLQDISLGGLASTLADDTKAEKLLHRLVLVHISLPSVTIDAVHRKYLPMQLDLIGAVRSINTRVQPATLHIRFVQRLPEELTPYLADLERRFLGVQHPLP